MRTELLTDVAALQRLREPWHALHSAAAGTIFQSYDWLSSWWKVFGERFGLRVLALWRDGDLVGLVPCYVAHNVWGKYARSMGEYVVFGAYAPLIRPDVVAECARPTAEFFDHLLRVDGCGFIDFHHIPSPSPFLDEVSPHLADRGCRDAVTEQSLPRLQVKLPSDWESYVRSLTPHERHFARMVVRFGERSAPPFVIRVRHDPDALNDLIRLHSEVWTSRGQKGYFNARGGFERFFRILLPGVLDRGTAAFYTMEAEGTVVATTVAFFAGSQSCAYLSGRLLDHPVKKYSPGKALLTAIIRDSISRGLASCDLMEGLTEYKFRVGGGLTWFARRTIFPRGIRGARGGLFLGLLAVRPLLKPKRLLQRVRSVRKHRTA